MTHRVQLTAIIVVCGIMASHHLYGQEKKELINAVQAYRKQFKDIQFDMHYKAEVIPGDPEAKPSQNVRKIQSLTEMKNDLQCKVVPDDPEVTKSRLISRMEIHTKIKRNLRYNDIKGWHKSTDEQPNRTVRAYDGKVTRQYYPSLSTGSIESGKNRSVSQFEYVHQILMWPKDAMAQDDPRRIVYDLVAVLEDDKTVVEAQTEKIHGVDTVVLNYSNGAMKVWLDIKHGAIVRRVKRVRPDGSTASTYDIPKLQKKNGIFFPEKLQYYTNDNTLSTIMTFDVPGTSLKINEGLEDEVFVFQFPPRTQVIDHVAGTHYIVKAPQK